jgi:hypothetical protein
MQYLCRDAATCGYSVSPQKHLPQLISEALAIGVSVFQTKVQPTPIHLPRIPAFRRQRYTTIST